MKLLFKVSPNYRQKQSTKQIMMELTLGLLVVFAFTLFYYATKLGSAYALKAILIVLVSCVVALLTEVIWCLITKNKILDYLKGSFPLVTAIIFALTLPVGTPLYVVGVGSFFAIFFGKLIFGGFGQNIFNPAGVGRAVVAASFANKLYTYLADASGNVLSGSGIISDAISTATPMSYMASQFNWMIEKPELMDKLYQEFGGLGNMFVGFYQGALGETSVLIIALVGIVLAIRKVIDWKVPVVYVGSVFVFACFISLGLGFDIRYPLFHVLTGGLLFGAVFMATDPVTNPTSNAGRIIYALGCGFFTVLIRIKANLPEGVLYSILLMNMLTPMIEKACDGNQIKLFKRYLITTLSIFVIFIATIFGVSTLVEPKVPVVEKPVPTIELYDLNDTRLLKVKAVITNREVIDQKVVYTVKAEGYAANQYDGDYNVYKVTIDEANKVIVGVEIVTLNDTEGISDVVKDESFLAKFDSLAISSDSSLGSDTTSGATYTTNSLVRAVKEVMGLYLEDELYKVENTGDNVYRVTYPGYYIAEYGVEKAKPNVILVTIENGKVKDVAIEKWCDSDGMDQITLDAILPLVKEKDAASIFAEAGDTFSTATYSMNSTLNAIKAAMNAASK